MTILIRVDGYKEIGMGHITRTLALAQGFRIKNCRVVFLVNQDDRSINLINKRHFEVHHITVEDEVKATLDIVLKEKANVYISDIYEPNKYLLKELKKIDVIRVQIDINRDMSMDVDLIVNGGIYANKLAASARSHHMDALLGAKYNLLREEFSNVPPKFIRKNLEEILIFFGGTDVNDLTIKTVHDVVPKFPNLKFYVISKDCSIGCLYPNVTVYSYVDNIDLMMRNVDLMITAGGVSLYELASLGTPAIIITQAENQVLQTQVFHDKGICHYHGPFESYQPNKLIEEIKYLTNHVNFRQEMSNRGQKEVDGFGVKRVVEYILECRKNEKYSK